MKYGYMFYRKPLPNLRKERPCNLGDPIQSIAVINLYKEMGISEEDMIPIDRFDAALYKGEEAIVTINGAENYEHYAYHTPFLPPAKQLIPVYFSLYFHRELDENTAASFREHGPVGCRDFFTVDFLRKNGVSAYLTGCLTMTYPRRASTEEQNTVFLIDCPSKLEEFIPEDIRSGAVRLTQVERIRSASGTDRMTQEETAEYHRRARERIELLRDRARLVVTSRFHAAVPSMAMGIPVILVKGGMFDPRFEILEKFLPLYTPDRFQEIDWDPEPVDIEPEKRAIKEAFFGAVNAARARHEIRGVFDAPEKKQEFGRGIDRAVEMLPFPKEGKFRYAVWGVCLHAAQILIEKLDKLPQETEFVAAIDTYQSGEYMGRPIIQPDRIAQLPEDVVVLVPAPSAHGAAKALLADTPRKFVLLKGSIPESYHF